MSNPWPLALIERVGLANIQRLRKTELSEARRWLLQQAPDLEADEVALVLSITLPDSNKETVEPKLAPPQDEYLLSMAHYRDRAIFLAAAWCAGASWGQLADMYKIQRQSVMASAAKHLPRPREQWRLSTTAPKLETLSLWKDWFYRDIERIRTSSVQEIAAMMLTLHDD